MDKLKKLKVAIAGCGSITRTRHAVEYSANPNCQIVGFYDFNKVKAQELTEIYGGKAYDSYEEMLGDAEVDAVSICTPNALHAQNTIMALNAGKHVLCEKPMALSTSEADDMISASCKSGKRLMPGHNQRFVATHVKARQILNEGIVGKVISVQTNFKHRGPEFWSIDKDKTWFFSDTLAGFGVLGDLGAHKIDLVRYLLGDEVESMFATLSTLDKKNADGELIKMEDNANCLFKMRSGIQGTMNVSWTNYGLEDNSTVVYGTLGTVKIFASELDDIVVDMNDGVCVKYHVGKISSNEEQVNSHIIDAFVETIIENKEPSVTGIDGRNTLSCLVAALESNTSGQWVKVKY